MPATLEERVAALEANQAVDQLNPNVLTVNPDGTIGANFTGHVHAAGIDLDAATSGTPPTRDELRWLSLADGATSAELFGQDLPALAKLFVYANRFRGRPRGVITLTANDNSPSGNAGIESQANTAAGPGATYVRVFIDNVPRLLLDDQLGSDFVQLGAPARSQAGQQTITWPGGTGTVFGAAIALPSMPNFVQAIATLNDYAAVGSSSLVSALTTPGHLQLLLQNPFGALPPAGAVSHVSWLAWGT